MLKDIDIKIHEDYYEKLELNRKKNVGYKPEHDSIIFQQVAEELGITKEEVEENFNRNEQEFESDLVYAEHKEEIDRLESEAEEFYGTAYNEHLQVIAEENENRSNKILELKCNLLKPVVLNDMTKISAHIRALKQELKNDTTYENRVIYKDVLRLLQKIQVA